jgi:4-aminobutyrate aminotransferase-like enzyme
MSKNEQILAKDRQYVIRAWHSVAEPVAVMDAKGAIVRDYDGKEYIDCNAGQFCMNIGYSHPAVIKAVQDQVTKVMQLGAHQTTQINVDYAEKIAGLAPGDLKKLHFCASGVEAVNVAIKMAKAYTGRYEILAFKNSYHGITGPGLAASGTTSYKKSFGPLEHGYLYAPCPYCYRCPLDKTYPACDLRCADEVEKIIKGEGISAVSEGSLAAVITEPLQCRGGIIPPKGWMTRVREICTRNGLLLIDDEVQAGFGRTGAMFCCNHENVVPDILTIAKNFGGGIPAGATLTRADIAEKFHAAAAPTFAGNVMACAAGMAATKVLVEEKLWENAAAMGKRFTEGFYAMKNARYVGDVRFQGLMGGPEMVHDKKTKAPFAAKEMAAIKEELTRLGVMLTYSGPKGNVFRIQPVLSITAEQVDQVIAAFDQAVSTVLKH